MSFINSSWVKLGGVLVGNSIASSWCNRAVTEGRIGKLLLENKGGALIQEKKILTHESWKIVLQWERISKHPDYYIAKAQVAYCVKKAVEKLSPLPMILPLTYVTGLMGTGIVCVVVITPIATPVVTTITSVLLHRHGYEEAGKAVVQFEKKFTDIASYATASILAYSTYLRKGSLLLAAFPAILLLSAKIFPKIEEYIHPSFLVVSFQLYLVTGKYKPSVGMVLFPLLCSKILNSLLSFSEKEKKKFIGIMPFNQRVVLFTLWKVKANLVFSEEELNAMQSSAQNLSQSHQDIRAVLGRIDPSISAENDFRWFFEKVQSYQSKKITFEEKTALLEEAQNKLTKPYRDLLNRLLLADPL